MMLPDEKRAVAILSEWRDLLAAVEAVALDPDGEAEALLAGLEERQRHIEGIQRLDADVKRLAAVGAKGWPGFSPEGAREAESLLAEARASRAATLAKDAETSKIIEEIRNITLSQIRNTGNCKRYLPPGKDAVKHTPIIVDGRL